ncbi:hypothetical protein CJF32_00010953 [Rutstroemia sp. NJR-2017a WRK4]|nr:hypothetical protein CJF32_00010953 [Rutstroemia sp. NJR-2017a WRK4]
MIQVTMGMCLVGALPYLRGLFLFVAQILGGITAAAIVSCLFPGPITFGTSLSGGTSIVQGLFIEMFLTAELVFTIFMLAAEKHKGTFIAPIGIGLSLFVAELTGLYFTGGSVNPARSFGPSVVSHQFNGYHWIYWVGPFLGAILASVFYKCIKMLEYETATLARVGEEFDPESHLGMPKRRDTGVSYDDSSMGAIGKELNGVGRHHENHTNGEHAANYGTPKEYGTARRPFSDSPAPPHLNDQFRGLAPGGMHADENVESPISPVSEHTLVENGGSPVSKKSAMETPGNRGSMVEGGNSRDNNQKIERDPIHEEYFEK